MKKGLFADAPDFPGKSGQRGDRSAVLPHFHGTRGDKFAQAGFQFGCEFH